MLSGLESASASEEEAAAGFPMNKRRKLKQQDQAPAGAPGADSQVPFPVSESAASRPELRVPGVESRAPVVKSATLRSTDAGEQGQEEPVDAAQQLQEARHVANTVKQDLGITGQLWSNSACCVP